MTAASLLRGRGIPSWKWASARPGLGVPPQLDRAGRVRLLTASAAVPPARLRGGRGQQSAPAPHDNGTPRSGADFPVQEEAPALCLQPGA